MFYITKLHKIEGKSDCLGNRLIHYESHLPIGCHADALRKPPSDWFTVVTWYGNGAPHA